MQVNYEIVIQLMILTISTVTLVICLLLIKNEKGLEGTPKKVWYPKGSNPYPPKEKPEINRKL